MSVAPGRSPWRSTAAALLLAVAVGGCGLLSKQRWQSGPVAALAGEPVRDFELAGRVSVKAEDKAYSGGLTWSRASNEETLRISTPLGQGAAEIHRQGAEVVLRDADGVTVAAETDALLMQRVLGIRLPLEGLVYWLSALPRPAMHYRVRLDETRRVVGLEQDGWRIEYDRYRLRQGRWLPGRIFARRAENLELRLVVDTWEPR